jgi:hypothetical protein
MYYTADNPPFGAVFTYYLKESLKTLKDKRKAREKKLAKENKPIPYPSWDELRAEDHEEAPYLSFTIRDKEGKVVRKLTTKGSSGIHRITWDLRYFGTSPIRLSENRFNPLSGTNSGMMVTPGEYTVTLSKSVNGEVTELAGPQPFNVKALDLASLPARDRQALVTYQRRAAELYRVVQGTASAANELRERIAYIRQALMNTPDAPPSLMEKAAEMNGNLQTILTTLNGDRTISRRNENPPTSLLSRLRTAASMHNRSTAPLTKTETDAFEIVKSEFTPLYNQIKKMIEVDLKILESGMEAARAPWTPGRLPKWETNK